MPSNATSAERDRPLPPIASSLDLVETATVKILRRFEVWPGWNINALHCVHNLSITFHSFKEPIIFYLVECS